MTRPRGPGPLGPDTLWIDVEGEELVHLIDDIDGQIAHDLPHETRIARCFLPCYPRHALLRIRIPTPGAWRETYAFHAPGYLYPLDWSYETLEAFDHVGLEIHDVDQAEAYTRFATWAQAPNLMRWILIESVDELPLLPGATLDDELRATLETFVHPLRQVPLEATDPEDAFRFEGAHMLGDQIAPATFIAGPRGSTSELPEGASVVDIPVQRLMVSSDEYFVLVRRTSMTADRFLREIRAGRPLHQARVTEPVRARGAVFPEPVILSQITFEHGADFEGAHFENALTLEHCVFEGQLRLREARVGGSVHAPGMRFHRAAKEGDAPPEEALKRTRTGVEAVDLEASGLRVAGSVYLEGARAPHVVDFSRAHIEGDLRLGGGDIGPRREATAEAEEQRALRLDSATIEGELDFVFMRDRRSAVIAGPNARAMDQEIPGFARAQTIIRGTIEATRVTVGGPVHAQGLRCDGTLNLTSATLGSDFYAASSTGEFRMILLGHLYAASVDIQGDMVLGGMYVGGSFFAFGSRFGGSIFVRTQAGSPTRIVPAEVKGVVDLSGIRAGDVEFEGAQLGDVRMYTGEVGRLRFQVGIQENATGPEGRRLAQLVPTRVRSISVSDVDVRKSVVLIGLQVQPGGTAEFLNLTCGGSFHLWNRRYATGITDPPEESEAWEGGRVPPAAGVTCSFPGDLLCQGLNLEGGLALAGVRAEGKILVKACVIGQDINLGAHGPPGASSDERTSTRCRELDLEMTRCGGDADFSGLRVEGAGEESSVHARNLRVAGRLLFSRPLRSRWDQLDEISQHPDARLDACIEGKLDLSVAEAQHLVLSGTSFGEDDPERGISLERGRFDRLQVLRPWPTRHDLSDVKVQRWDIPSEDLLTFLARSKPFRRRTYTEVEGLLRNEAREAEADRVYRAMRMRAIEEAKEERARRKRESVETDGGERRLPSRAGAVVSHILRTTGSRLLGLVYGWGTLYWLPLAAALPFFLLSWGIFAEPGNVVEHSDAPVAASRPGGASTPSWDRSDGFWMAVRYHVPVVPAVALQDWHPSRAPARLPLPDGRALVFRFSVEGYATAIYMLHWIIWPLFLYGLARRIIREKR